MERVKSTLLKKYLNLPPIPLLQFRFATWKDKVMMVVGSLCALIHGAASPLMLLVYSMMTDTFVAYEREIQELNDPNKTCNGTIHWSNGSVYFTAENDTVQCGWDITDETGGVESCCYRLCLFQQGGHSSTDDHVCILLHWNWTGSSYSQLFPGKLCSPGFI